MRVVLAIALVLLVGCSSPTEVEQPVKADAIIGLASPVTLEDETTTFLLSDYFQSIDSISEVTCEGVDVSWKQGESEVAIEGKLASSIGAADSTKAPCSAMPAIKLT